MDNDAEMNQGHREREASGLLTTEKVLEPFPASVYSLCVHARGVCVRVCVCVCVCVCMQDRDGDRDLSRARESDIAYD